jgi:hypothetical protein
MTSKKTKQIMMIMKNNSNPVELDLLKKGKNRRLIDYHETVLTRTGCGLILNNCCLGSGKWNEMRKIERKKRPKGTHRKETSQKMKHQYIYCRSLIL